MPLVLPTYVADISHDIFFVDETFFVGWEPVFYVDICYPKRRHFFSILDKCQNIGYVATFLKIYATKPRHATQHCVQSNRNLSFVLICFLS